MVPLTKGQQDPELSMGSALVLLHLAQKAKTGVSDVERKAGSLLLLLHYTLFWRACRMSIDLFCPQDARRFYLFLVASL